MISSILVGSMQNSANAQNEEPTVQFRMSEVSIITERHSVAEAQKVNGEITLIWMESAIYLIWT